MRDCALRYDIIAQENAVRQYFIRQKFYPQYIVPNARIGTTKTEETMKLLTLTVRDAEENSVVFTFDGTSNSDYAEEKIAALKDALFGNDALFSGQAELKVEDDGVQYLIVRDFANGVKVIIDGEELSAKDAETVISDLAALSQKQWEVNATPCDVTEFSTDVTGYVEKFLSSMGIDGEELDVRYASLREMEALTEAQIVALNELTDDTVADAYQEKKSMLDEAEEELSKWDEAAKETSDNELFKARLAKVQESIDALESEREIYDEKYDRLQNAVLAAEDAAKEAEKNTIADENQTLKAEVDELTSALESEAEEIAEAEGKLSEAEEELTQLEAQVAAIKAEFIRMLRENPDKGEVTDAAMDNLPDDGGANAEALGRFQEWDVKFLDISERLAKERYDFVQSRNIREGVVFESTIDNKYERLLTVDNIVNMQLEFIASLEKEIASSKALIASRGEISLEELDNRRQRLQRASMLCQTLNLEIAATRQKIRDNEDASASYSDDIASLEKARQTLVDYVNKCEEKRKVCRDRIIGLRARLSFSENVDSLEYGSVCPVCKGRIVDKADITRDNDRLRAALKRFTDDMERNNQILSENHEKLGKIDSRLGQLKERKRICEIYISSLINSINSKENTIHNLLTEVGATSLPVLERMIINANNAFARHASVGDGTFLSEHVRYLESQVAEINKKVNPLFDEAANLVREIDQMGADYESYIAPTLDGRSAYSYLEEVVQNEESEDNLYAQLREADEMRAQALEDYLQTQNSDSANLIGAVSSVVLEVSEELRNLESTCAQLREYRDSLVAELAEKRSLFDKKVAIIEEKLASVELNNAALAEFDANENSEEDARSEAVATELAAPMTDEEIATINQEIQEYVDKLDALKLTAATLSEAIVETEYDADRHAELKLYVKELREEVRVLGERLASSNAASNLAQAKNDVKNEVSHAADLVKYLADSEIFDVVLPVINEVFAAFNSGITASAEGLGLKYTIEDKRGVKKLAVKDMDENILSIALDSALNYTLRLVKGSATIRFVRGKVDGKYQNVLDKFGLAVL